MLHCLCSSAYEIITITSSYEMAVITVISGFDTQTRLMGHFPLD